MTKPIDFSRPLRIKRRPGDNGPDLRPVIYAGALRRKPDGDFVHHVMVPYSADRNNFGDPMPITEWGVPIGEGVFWGCALRFENVPQEKSGFWPVYQSGDPAHVRGLISLEFAKRDYPSYHYFLEIIMVDDIPMRAEIHHV